MEEVTKNRMSGAINLPPPRPKTAAPTTNVGGGPQLGEAKPVELKFEQKNSGEYEAEFKAEEAGSYFVNAQATRKVKIAKDGKEIEVEEGVDSVRAGVTFLDQRDGGHDLTGRAVAALEGVVVQEGFLHRM